MIDILPLFNSLVCTRVEGESISKYGWVGDESVESLDTAQQLFMSGDNTYISIGGGWVFSYLLYFLIVEHTLAKNVELLSNASQPV